MYSELVIGEGIIYLENEAQFHPTISLKLCAGQHIYKFHDFEWDALTHRWQNKDRLKIPWPTCDLIQLEIYKHSMEESGVVLG